MPRLLWMLPLLPQEVLERQLFLLLLLLWDHAYLYHLGYIRYSLFPYHPVAIHPICILLGITAIVENIYFFHVYRHTIEKKKNCVNKDLPLFIFQRRTEGLYLIISRTVFSASIAKTNINTCNASDGRAISNT